MLPARHDDDDKHLECLVYINVVRAINLTLSKHFQGE